MGSALKSASDARSARAGSNYPKVTRYRAFFAAEIKFLLKAKRSFY
jgi:hypothetical protein